VSSVPLPVPQFDCILLNQFVLIVVPDYQQRVYYEGYSPEGVYYSLSLANLFLNFFFSDCLQFLFRLVKCQWSIYIFNSL